MRLAAGALLTGAVACLAWRKLSLRATWLVVAQANPLLLALSAAAMLANVGLKVLRWQWLFYPEGKRLRRRHLLAALMVGQLGNVLLPVRLGDLARVWVVDAREHTGGARTLATLLVEKAADALMLLAATASLLPFFPVARLLSGARVAAGAGLVLLLILLTWLGARESLQLHALGVLRRACPTAAIRHVEAARQALAGLPALRHRRVQVRLWGFSIALWLLSGLVNWFGFAALGLDLPLAAGLLLAVTEIAGNNLAYAPAAVGVYHSICAITLSPFGVDWERALSVGILLHLVVYLPIVAIGLASLWSESLGLQAWARGQLRGTAQRPADTTSVLAGRSGK